MIGQVRDRAEPMDEQGLDRATFLGLSAREVLESIGESVVVIDRDFRVVWVKEPLLAHFRPGIEAVGRPCYSILAGRDAPCQRDCPVAPVFATGRPQKVEKQLTGPRGEERWREAHAYPLLDREGRVVLAARISFDITRRKRDQARRRRDLANLERSLDQLNRSQMGQPPLESGGGRGLTRRELEVLRLMAQGLSKPQVARVLAISPNTVKRHAVNIFNKLGVNDRAQAAVWAARQGLI